MRGSRLDRTISFERPVKTTEAKFGTKLPVDWVRVVTCRARRQDVRPSHSESVRLATTVARNQATFYCRWRGDITPDMRIVEHGDADVIYQIIGGPAEVGDRKTELEILCERYTS